MLTPYLTTLLVMSLASVIVYAVDKLNSMRDGERVPEIVLIALTTLGGSVGTILGMIFFNHKSNMSHKWHFFFTILFSFIIQLTLFIMCLVR
ncbi:MAG: DUF1294 domain-containing protein [Clostridia bacterium]|nr:DUF1294 domain-containing protein [Clostridia bacterium]